MNKMNPSDGFGYYYDKDGNVQYFCGLEGLYKEIEKAMGTSIVHELKSFHDERVYEAVMGLTDKYEDVDEESLEEYLQNEVQL